MGRLTSTAEITPSRGANRQSPIQTNCLILGPSQPTIPNNIQIQSAVFPQSTGQTDRWSRWQNQHPLTLY